MYIYRVQDHNGDGPYTAARSTHCYGCLKGHNDSPNHPNIRTDFPREIKSYKPYYCAFKSLKQLNEWFTKAQLKQLNKDGFIIKRFNVKKYCLGKSGRQIFFKFSQIVKSNKNANRCRIN